ncbi:hypothetical protein EB232_26790 [Mesorhizobium sp. NZP2077]|nr:hypothetical protein EB232_26790 [Mesorhizobium sp. NZP2077]
MPKRVAIKMIGTARDEILFSGCLHPGQACFGPVSGHDPAIMTFSRPRPEGALLGDFQNVRQRAMGGPLPLEESTMTD